MQKRYLIFLFTFWFAITLQAQDETENTTQPPIRAYLQSSNPTPTLGEPFVLTLFVEIPNDAEITEWLQVSEQWGNFYIEHFDESEITGVQRDNITTYQQPIEVLLWTLGDNRIPPTSIKYKLAGSIAPEEIFIESTPTLVQGIVDLSTAELRPSRPPIDIDYVPIQTIAILGAVGAVALGGIAIFANIMLRAKRNRVAPTKSTGDPTQDALIALRDQKLSPKNYYGEIAKILRGYLKENFAMNSYEMTTREISNHLRLESKLVMHQQDTLRQILKQCDLVKFTDTLTDIETNEATLTSSLKWVETTNNHLQAETNND